MLTLGVKNGVVVATVINVLVKQGVIVYAYFKGAGKNTSSTALVIDAATIRSPFHSGGSVLHRLMVSAQLRLGQQFWYNIHLSSGLCFHERARTEQLD